MGCVVRVAKQLPPIGGADQTSRKVNITTFFLQRLCIINDLVIAVLSGQKACGGLISSAATGCEPILHVGETGGGKKKVLSAILMLKLHILNCHQYSTQKHLIFLGLVIHTPWIPSIFHDCNHSVFWVLESPSLKVQCP